jgi:peptidyl-prolyl cis-trans isomerase C
MISSLLGMAAAFSPSAQGVATLSLELHMGLFNGIAKAFKNTEYGPPPEAVKALARHILVPTEAESQVVMKTIASGKQAFEACAQDFSTCPSASKGGLLGSFLSGSMVPKFDKVIFDPEIQIGQVAGPVLINFGFHVIVVEK